LNLLGYILQPIEIPAGDDYLCTVATQFPCTRFTNTTGPSDNDSHFPIQSERISHSISSSFA
jgi:hypothetical protein